VCYRGLQNASHARAHGGGACGARRTLTPRTAGRAGRCRGLRRYRDLLDLKIQVRIPALEDGAQFPVERPHARL